MVAGRLVALLAFLLLRFERGRSHDNPLHALVGLRTVDAAAAAMLDAAFRALVDDDAREPLITAATDILERLGGACWHGLRTELPGPLHRPHRTKGTEPCTDQTPTG